MIFVTVAKQKYRTS